MLSVNTNTMFLLQTGWMMWNWFVSALAVGAAIVCYDGSPLVPKPNIIWDLVDEIGFVFYSFELRVLCVCVCVCVCKVIGITYLSENADTQHVLHSSGRESGGRNYSSEHQCFISLNNPVLLAKLFNNIDPKAF